MKKLSNYPPGVTGNEPEINPTEEDDMLNVAVHDGPAKHPVWTMLNPRATPEVLGYIPYWLNEHDPDGAAKQIHKHYTHGGGWQPFDGMSYEPGTGVMSYPGDPDMRPLAACHLHREMIVFYPHSWVAVVQPDGSFEVARID